MVARGSALTLYSIVVRDVLILVVLLCASSTTSAFSNSLAKTTAVGPAHWLLQRALDSSLFIHVMIPMAKHLIISTAQENGIPWTDCYTWISQHCSQPTDIMNTTCSTAMPEWYRVPYHSYHPNGHMCWQAAFEAELAGAAVGARNCPDLGRHGEEAFREQFAMQLRHHSKVYQQQRTPLVLVDVGCATGVSTRWLASTFPNDNQNTHIVGIDLSPYMIHVAQFLQQRAPSPPNWITAIDRDDRIEFLQGDFCTGCGLPDGSVDVVNLQFVAHELPPAITIRMLHEARRVLHPDHGELWISEMDFTAPAYMEARANTLAFSMQRATEPYLDEYADGQVGILDTLQDLFGSITITPATGRHFAIVASVDADGEGGVQDLRYDAQGKYKVEDTHLKVWENKR